MVAILFINILAKALTLRNVRVYDRLLNIDEWGNGEIISWAKWLALGKVILGMILQKNVQERDVGAHEEFPGGCLENRRRKKISSWKEDKALKSCPSHVASHQPCFGGKWNMVLVTGAQEAKATDTGFTQTRLVWFGLVSFSKQNNPQD